MDLLSLSLLFIPSIVVLSGKSAVLILLLFSVYPLFLFIKKRKKIDFLKGLTTLDRFLILSSVSVCVIYVLVQWHSDSFVLFLRVLVLIFLTLVSSDYYNGYVKKHKSRINENFYLYGIFIAMLVFAVEKMTQGTMSAFLTSVISPDKNFLWPKQLNAMNRGMCFLSIAIWPATYPLFCDIKKNNIKILCVFLCLFLIIFDSNSETAQLSLLGAVVSAAIILLLKKQAYKIFFIGFIIFPIVFLIVLSLINPQLLSEKRILMPSALARVCIWKYTAEASLQNIYGHGFDSSANKEYQRLTNDMNVCVEGNRNNGMGHTNFYYGMQMHPHQNFLQIFFELGVFGLLLYILINLRIIYILLNSDKSDASKVVMFNIFLSFTLVGLTGYGFWQNWLIAALLFNILISKTFCSRH